MTYTVLPFFITFTKLRLRFSYNYNQLHAILLILNLKLKIISNTYIINIRIEQAGEAAWVS